MMAQMDLPGLERLLNVCRSLGAGVRTSPPGRAPPAAGTLLAGHPLDPLLAAFYARFGHAVFASDVAGLGLFRLDDSANALEAQNQQWRSDWQERLPVPLFVFGGESGQAYSYATVPGLADALGRQPVVLVDTYEEPYALPVASNLDQLFDVYSRYLEALLAHADFAEYGSAALAFPWDVTDLLARDERLVELMRAGHFDSLMPRDVCTRNWVARLTDV